MLKTVEKQTQQVRSNGWIDAESDWELRRLSRMWGIPIAQARQRCYHYMGAICRKSHDRSITDSANIRQAQANVEMLKGR